MNKNKSKSKSGEKGKRDRGIKRRNYRELIESGRKDRSNKK